jgi:hypothetical protein
LNWGNPWGWEKGMGREWKQGRSVCKQPGTRVDEDRTTQKGGIPSKSEGLGYKGSYQGESSKGELLRGITKDSAMCSVSSTCIYVSCYCVNVANKRIVFRL